MRTTNINLNTGDNKMIIGDETLWWGIDYSGDNEPYDWFLDYSDIYFNHKGEKKWTSEKN